MADTHEIINCPACNCMMKKVFIKKVKKYIDVCLKCGGIFFDNQEFKHFDESCESVEEIESALVDCKYEKVDDSKQRNCPSCGALMVRNTKGVIVDDCYTCGGRFLDGGELQLYRNEYTTDEQRTVAFNNLLSNELTRFVE